MNNVCVDCAVCGTQPTDTLPCCKSYQLADDGYCGHKPTPQCTSWRDCGAFATAICCTEAEDGGRCVSWLGSCRLTCGTTTCSFPYGRVQKNYTIKIVIKYKIKTTRFVVVYILFD